MKNLNINLIAKALFPAVCLFVMTACNVEESKKDQAKTLQENKQIKNSHATSTQMPNLEEGIYFAYKSCEKKFEINGQCKKVRSEYGSL